jgi:K+-transporting ATPase ATPase B chain
MIALVEGITSETPNEIALTILLAGFTIIFVIVCVTLPFGDFASTPITMAAYFIVRLSDPYYHRWIAECDWHCRYGQSIACQCDHQSGKAVETAGDLIHFYSIKPVRHHRKPQGNNFWPANSINEKSSLRHARASPAMKHRKGNQLWN